VSGETLAVRRPTPALQDATREEGVRLVVDLILHVESQCASGAGCPTPAKQLPMLPSSTVENYLKALYQAESADDDRHLVPMGQLATAVGVAPGTATTMVKALAESGLVDYEPYVGVRLSSAGAKLAALVLRRHRLIEQFLVEIMGMSWADVHEEAEQLEHVVSERLIDRIDAMLGHPSVDPHGDPIPAPDGAMESHNYHTLLTCPLRTPVTVTRVADQNANFLRFLEAQELKPGQSVEVEARDDVADSVRLRTGGERQVILGTKAASKVLIDIGPQD